MKILFFIFVFILSVQGFAKDYRPLYDCKIEANLYDAPRAFVHPQVAIVIDQDSVKSVALMQEPTEYLALKDGDSIFTEEPEVVVSSGEGVHVKEFINGTTSAMEATVLFETPKLQYACQLSSETDENEMIYDAIKSTPVLVRESKGSVNIVVMEKSVGSLRCLFASVINAKETIIGFQCSLGAARHDEVYDGIKANPVISKSTGATTSVKRVGLMKCTKTEVMNPDSPAQYSCVLPR